MKGLGIALVGLLAVAGGIAAATYITKRKLEKDNEEDYYDDWDDIDDEDIDFDFEEDSDVSGKSEASEPQPVVPETKSGDFAEDVAPDEPDETL